MQPSLLTDYRDALQKAFHQRKMANPAYSLRAFARDLELAPASLSEVLNRRSGLSLEKAHLITTNLGLSDVDREIFLASVQMFHSRQEQHRKTAWEKLRSVNLQKLLSNTRQLSASSFSFNGLWKVSLRMGHDGKIPKAWHEEFETQHFLIQGDQFEFHQDRVDMKNSVIKGQFDLDGDQFLTHTNLQQSVGRSETETKPWLAEAHRVQWIHRQQFHLSTASQFFKKTIGGVSASLETMWTKIK